MTKSKTSRTLQIQKEPTRKQLSRAERDAKQRRRFLLVFGGVVLLAVLVVVYGYLHENVFILDEPVADVNGQTISTREFQARVRLQRQQVEQQMAVAQSLNDQQTYQYYQQQLADPLTLGQQTLSNMIDELLLVQAAPTFGVTVTQDEVQTYIEKQFNFDRNPPTPAPTNTPRPTPTVTGPITQTPTPTFTPFPTRTPVTQEGFNQLYADAINQVSQLGFTEQSYRSTIERTLLADKVRQAIESSVITTTEQVKFRYIRIDSQDVPTVTQSVQQDGFESVYHSIISGTYPITTVQAADTLDWLPRDEISTTVSAQLADALFTTPLSQTLSVISDQPSEASYIAQVYARGVQPLNSSILQSRQQQAVEAWLQERRNPAFYLTWEDRVPTTP